MSQVVLQVPVSKSLKQKAEIVARGQGVSLTETIRKFLSKFARRELVINTQPEEVKLSPRAIKRYNKAIDEIRQGKGIVKAKDAQDFLRKLRS